MWLYLSLAAGILVAITVPLVAGTRVIALSLEQPEPDDPRDALDPRLRALIESYP